MKEFLKKNNIIIIASITFSFMMGFFGPIEFYFSNIYNVWYDIYNILPMCIITSALMFAALLLIGVALNSESKKGKIYIYVLCVLTICLYIQGTFIKIPYGEMNGETIEWDKFAGDELKSSLIWIALIIIATIIYKKKQSEKMFSVLKTIMVCLIIIQFISLIIVGTTGEGFAAKKSMRPVDEEAFTYSKDENLIILVLDTFDSRVFEDYILNGNEQKVASQYCDFTYFRDTMGMFTLTNYAFPQIVTGEKYLGDIYYGDYIEQSYENSTLLNRLVNENWDIRIHTDQRLPKLGGNYFINEKELTYEVENNQKMAAGIYKLVMFKYFPTALKKYVYYPYEYLESYKKVKMIDGIDADRCSYTEDDWDNKAFYDSFVNINDESKEKCCQIYHIKGLHALRNLNSNLQYIDNPNEYYSLEQEAAVVSDIVAEYIERLKSTGVYDNSTIIIMADHGSVEYKYEEDNFAQCPLLLIKAKEEKHNFEISNLPVSYEDLQNIYSSLLDGEKSSQAAVKAISLSGYECEDEDFEVYGIEGLDTARHSECVLDNPIRRRYMIYHRFTGNLGGRSKGGIGYELYTDYPAYFGNQIQFDEKAFP